MKLATIGCRFAATLATIVTIGAAAHDPAPAQHSHPQAAVALQMPFGIAGDRRDVARTIELRMQDRMRFVPDAIDVREGETVRLMLKNDGKLMHELVLGTRPALEAHAAMMRDGAMAHDEPYIAHVAPGKRGEIVWKFNRAGRFDFACLVPGHFEGGMTGTVNVRPR
jgi:uncharacterized cupredoxin-like copper-binding protein